jgi:AcrR family transcriptional regulator
METVADEVSAEERIKKAAKLIFTKKGFLATTVRDIAAEADINVASVNYYFRSKEKLFELIMAETIEKTFAEVEPVFYNTSLSLLQKIELMADHFINKALNEPDLPLFLVREVMAGSNSLPLIRNLPAIMESDFAKQVMALNTSGKIQYNAFHIILNMGSMLVFPFLSLNQVTNFGNATKEEFFELMQERKKLIPIWLGQMIGASA